MAAKFNTGVIVLLVLGGIVYWLMPEEDRVAARYNVPPSRVLIEKKPQDCQFDAALLGNTYCHYDKVVSLERDNSGKVTGVCISWERKQD